MPAAGIPLYVTAVQARTRRESQPQSCFSNEVVRQPWSVIRRWLSLGLIPGPPWTQAQLLEIRDLTDPEGRRRGNRGAHGTITRWNAGCSCTRCRRYQSEAARARGRSQAQQRLPVQMRQQPLDAIYEGRPFRTVLRDLGLTSNQVWGLAKTDREWSEELNTALNSSSSERPQARHQRGLCARVCLPRVPRAPEHSDGQESSLGQVRGRV